MYKDKDRAQDQSPTQGAQILMRLSTLPVAITFTLLSSGPLLSVAPFAAGADLTVVLPHATHVTK